MGPPNILENLVLTENYNCLKNMVGIRNNIIIVNKIIINNNDTSCCFLLLSGNPKLLYDYIYIKFFKTHNYRDKE